MTSGAADRPPSEHDREAPARTLQSQAGQREPERHERCGPLTLLRTRKGDGRALLLFSHPAEHGER
jgi:hypothetical protein